MAKNLIVRAILSICALVHMILAFALSLIPSKTGRQIVQMIFGVPFFFVTIMSDRLLFPVGKRFNPFVSFPRNTIEVTQRGKEFFDLIKEYQKTATVRDYSTLSKDEAPGQFSPLPIPGPIPADAEFVSLKRMGETDDFIKETLKQIQVSFYELIFKSGGKTTRMELFVKMPGQRGVTKFLLALGNTFQERGQEQRFYEDILPHVDPAMTNVPHGYACFGTRAFAHICIVAAKVDTKIWKSYTDAQTMNLSQGQALVKASARLHAQFWAPPKDCPKTKRFEERRSLSYIYPGLKMYFSDKESQDWRCPAWMTSLWATLWEFYDESIMTIGHTDCRPGNMLFSSGPSPGSEQSKPVPGGPKEKVPTAEIIMTDWEACSFVPASYDFCYSCLCGLPPFERRMHQRYLFEMHYAAVVDALKKKDPSKVKEFTEGTPKVKETSLPQDRFALKSHKDRFELEIDLHPIVIYYFGWLLAHIGGVGESQGNLEGDTKAWGDRIRCGMLDGLLCSGGDYSTMDGYDAWRKPHTVGGGCNCKDKTTMAELGIIDLVKKGNVNPPIDPSTEAVREHRTRIGNDGAIISAKDPDYANMHLNERVVHYLEHYHKKGREVNELMAGAAKSNPKKYNRTLKQDLLDCIKSASIMGLEDSVKKAKEAQEALEGKKDK